MKKVASLLLLMAILTSCTTPEVVVEQANEEIDVVNTDYVVWGKANSHFNVYGNVLNNNLKVLTSNINGKVTYLQCEAGQKVNRGTVIARITPDPNSLSYKNNVVQLNSLKSQLANLKQIRATTISNFESRNRQLKLKESELQNQLNTVNQTIWNDNQWVKNQLKIIEESLVLLEKNRESSIANIDDSILNLRKTAYNNIESGLKRLDETFGITEKNKDLNDKYEDYIGAKNTSKRNTLKVQVKQLIADFEKQDGKLSLYSDENLSAELSNISNVFKESADVVDNSISSMGALTQATIDGLYKEFLAISNGLITAKNNYDTLINTRKTTVLKFDSEVKKLESSQSELNTKTTNLTSNISTINNNSENIKEQYKDLENTKSSTLKEMDINILGVEQAINQLNITFREDVVYAGTVGTIKTKNISKNNNLAIGTPVCTIVPDDNSLKLEVYSPNALKMWMEFKYYFEGELIGTGSIISESPVRNAMTQNYTYDGKIDFEKFKEGDYVDVKVITQVSSEEIWIPINYIFPKLDGYYVNMKNGDTTKVTKVEIGKMNNWEILIKSGIDFWDTLQQ